MSMPPASPNPYRTPSPPPIQSSQTKQQPPVVRALPHRKRAHSDSPTDMWDPQSSDAQRSPDRNTGNGVRVVHPMPRLFHPGQPRSAFAATTAVPGINPFLLAAPFGEQVSQDPSQAESEAVRQAFSRLGMAKQPATEVSGAGSRAHSRLKRARPMLIEDEEVTDALPMRSRTPSPSLLNLEQAALSPPPFLKESDAEISDGASTPLAFLHAPSPDLSVLHAPPSVSPDSSSSNEDTSFAQIVPDPGAFL